MRLPDMPRGVFQLSGGPRHHLLAHLLRQGVSFPKVVVDATGCQTVTGLGEDSLDCSHPPSSGRDLGEVMGLQNPNWATFRGAGA